MKLHEYYKDGIIYWFCEARYVTAYLQVIQIGITCEVQKNILNDKNLLFRRNADEER